MIVFDNVEFSPNNNQLLVEAHIPNDPRFEGFGINSLVLCRDSELAVNNMPNKQDTIIEVQFPDEGIIQEEQSELYDLITLSFKTKDGKTKTLKVPIDGYSFYAGSEDNLDFLEGLNSDNWPIAKKVAYTNHNIGGVSLIEVAIPDIDLHIITEDGEKFRSSIGLVDQCMNQEDIDTMRKLTDLGEGTKITEITYASKGYKYIKVPKESKDKELPNRIQVVLDFSVLDVETKQKLESNSMESGLFYLWAEEKPKANKYSECTPCSISKSWWVSIITNPINLYRKGYGYIKELADKCSTPQGLLDFILHYNAFKIAAETCNIDMARKAYSQMYLTKEVTINRGCGCYGK